MAQKLKDQSDSAKWRRRIYGKKIRYWVYQKNEKLKDAAAKMNITPQHMVRVVKGEVELKESFISKFVTEYGLPDKTFDDFLLSYKITIEELQELYSKEEIKFINRKDKKDALQIST